MACRRFRTIKLGRKISLEMTVKEYRKLMDQLEQLECLRAFDAAAKTRRPPIPLLETIRRIERHRT
jgi:hypothetical protein